MINLNKIKNEKRATLTSKPTQQQTLHRVIRPIFNLKMPTYQMLLPMENLPENDSFWSKNSTINRKPAVSWIRFKELRKTAQEAIKSGKIFTIYKRYGPVGPPLRKRGWIQVLQEHWNDNPSGTNHLKYSEVLKSLPASKSGETREQYISRCEVYVLSRLVQHVPITFLWSCVAVKDSSRQYLENPAIILNRLGETSFSKKQVLNRRLKNCHWHHENGVAVVNFPRCYNAYEPEEMAEFVENFRNTACICFLKNVMENRRKSIGKTLFSRAPNLIPFSAFEFALKHCYNIFYRFIHNYIDREVVNIDDEQDWNAFFEQHRLLTSKNLQIELPAKPIDMMLKNAELLLEALQMYWPQYHMDGYRNIWILKPNNRKCGSGIRITNSLSEINKFAERNPYYVIQKYVERPLTIYNTKGDFRQWFLVTSCIPLTIWMYRNSYVRLSSQPFTLDNFHESIHVTNYTVQKKYTVHPERDRRIQQNTMWDSRTFQAYLRQIGKSDAWKTLIYPAMKEAIIGVMLSCQDKMKQRENNFELFGADFIITDDFKPWLMEINCAPDFSNSTDVTTRLCPMCAEDIIKVVVDRKENPKASTGEFERIYQQSNQMCTCNNNRNLLVKGKPVHDFLRKQLYKQMLSTSGFIRQVRL